MTRRYSEQTAHEIDEAVRRLVEQAFASATDILRQRRAVLERMAQRLLETETLTGADLKALMGGETPRESGQLQVV